MLKITVRQGSIVDENADAVVVPTNTAGSMPGGFAAAIKSAAGEEVEEEAIAEAPIHIGEAVATGAGNLICHFLIHAPITEFAGGKTDEHAVTCAIDAALEIAEANQAGKIAIPGMGTGSGGLTAEESARATFAALRRCTSSTIKEVILIDLREDVVKAWEKENKR